MKIDISRHAIKRAKQRFKLKQKSLIRMLHKAIKEGEFVQHDVYRFISYIYGHYQFILVRSKGKLILMTVTNLLNSQSHLEDFTVSKYYKGKVVGKKCIKGELYETK